ncbi:hypothetical protein SAMN05428642_101981 [Flaviramulus basaltis]|uniref:Uncharacterized protein n=1 Tax=Flaviramulus basaltis TaxID=369401 RepID=A0A1K2IE16_9FLAO|nr:hypothetical protein [Flaviramulus basaltis]SFZ90514.1 hypothetical protein SAMN05428642_101981 [Flaviramulus basaltis]
MRYLLLLIVVFGGCKSNKAVSFVEEVTANELCPEEGNCSYEILKNKKINYNYNNLSDFYPTFSEGDKLVFKFEYKQNEIPNTQDSSYREEVIIELDSTDLEFETTTFKGEKILFARWCYCKGQTGYYKIQQGKLSVKKIENNTYQLNLNFKMEQVPQVIIEIKHVFSLE